MLGGTGLGQRWLLILWIVVVGTLSVGLRFWEIGEAALWHDEIASQLRAEGRFWQLVPTDGEPMAKRAPTDEPRGSVLETIWVKQEPWPPLYYVTLRGWSALFGDSPGALRSLSALCACLNLVLATALAWIVGGRRAAWFASLLLAGAGHELLYAQEARGYMLLTTWLLGATTILAWIEKAGANRKRWLLYALFAALAMATNYTSVLALGAHLLYWLLRRRPPTLAGLPWALLGAAALFSPLIPLAIAQASFMPTSLDWLGEPLTEATSFWAQRAHVPRTGVNMLATWIAAGAGPQTKYAMLFLTSMLAVVAMWRTQGRHWLVGLVALAAPATLITYDAVFAAQSTLATRFIVQACAPLWVCVALGLCKLRPWLMYAVLAALLVGQAEGVVAIGATTTKSADYASVGSALKAFDCNDRDLVICMLAFNRQQLEVNAHIPGQPTLVFVDRRFNPTLLRTPWRNVFLIVYYNQTLKAKNFRKFLGTYLKEVDHGAFESVELYRYLRP